MAIVGLITLVVCVIGLIVWLALTGFARIKKRVACEEHLERLLATLDEVVVREQIAAGDKPTVKKTAQQ